MIVLTLCVGPNKYTLGHGVHVLYFVCCIFQHLIDEKKPLKVKHYKLLLVMFDLESSPR